MKKKSRKIISLFVLLALVVAMLPLNVLAADKLANPTMVMWLKDKKNMVVWAGWDRSENANSYTINIYEDGSLIDSISIGDGVGIDVKNSIWKRDYEGHTYTFGVIAMDSTGKYANSNEAMCSTALNTDWLSEIYGTDKPVEKKITWTTDINGGIKKFDGSNTTEMTAGGTLEFIVQDLTEEDKQTVVAPPEGMVFDGFEINGQVFHIGNKVNVKLDTDILFKYLWRKEGSQGGNSSPAKVTNWLDPIYDKLAVAAVAGNPQNVEITGDYALPYTIMKYLQDHPQITLIYHLTYNGAESTLIIPGSKVKANPDINWYGPLYLKAYYETSVAGNGSYIVQPGDNLYQIAIKFNTTVNALVQKNNIPNPNLIHVGQTIVY